MYYNYIAYENMVMYGLEEWESIFEWAIPGLFFLYFRLFDAVDNKLNWPMTAFLPHISGSLLSEATAVRT